MRRLAVFLLAALPIAAQHSPYAGMESRPIKALSAEDESGLREGRGMRLALAAELNGYPGPKHVLELAADLGIDARQLAGLQAVEKKMHDEAAAIGTEVVDLERRLDQAFASGAIDSAGLADLTGRIAVLQGRLRYVHLDAHLATKALLTPEQVAAYNRARGYASSHGEHHGKH